MTIYSVMPEEHIFAGMNEHNPSYIDLELNGITMQAEVLSPTQARIVRLYSPNANDYMNPRYAPGTIVQFRPTI